MSGDVRIVDASGYPVDLTVLSRSINTAANLPVVVIGGDHPYLQWWGTNGSDGLAALYLNRGIKPYMAICTDDQNGEMPGASGRMSWAQIGTLKRQGVEIVNHGARHVNSWARCTSGFTLQYTGAGTDAQISVNASHVLTTTCTGAAGDNQTIDLTLTANNTLGKLVATLNATGVYSAQLAVELTGNESSLFIPVITGLGIKCSSTILTNATATAWASGTVYSVGDIRRAVAGNGYLFVCTTGGTSGGAEPSWTKQIGSTTTDNTVTWTCRYTWATLRTTSTVVTNGGINGTNVCCSGGIMVLFNDKSSGTQKKVGAIKIASTTLTMYEDGVPIQAYNLTSAANDTLTEVVALINGNTNWYAKLADNTTFDSVGGQKANDGNNNYCSGGEGSRSLANATYVDCTNRWQRFDLGLTQWYVMDRLISKAHATALAQGITFTAFAQSGGECYEWLCAQHSQYYSWRGDTFSRASVHPNSTAVHTLREFGGWASYKDMLNTPTLTSAYLNSYLDGLIESGPCVWYSLCHGVTSDGTSGYNLTGFTTSPAVTESTLNTFVQYLQTKIAAGVVRNLQPSQLPQAIQLMNAPRNLIKNPNFRNYGGTIASLSSDSSVVGEWLTRTGTTPTISIDANGVLSITAIGSQQIPLSQDLLLVPGETYELSALVTFDNTAVTNGVRFQLQTRSQDLSGAAAGMRFLDIDPAVGQALISPYFASSQLCVWRFTVPKRQDYFPAYIRSRNAQTFDLSVNNKIQVNYDNIGNTADINCAGGTPAATTAKEIAAAINTAVAGTAAYAAKPEYHNIAQAIDGRVVIQSPYRGNTGASSTWIRVLSGSATDALATIFGGVAATTCQGEPLQAMPNAMQDRAMLLVFDVNTTAGGVVQIQSPMLRLAREP